MMEGKSAKEELKRVDHLIFVTLKYTRTVDIIRNVIERLISAMDYQVIELLEYYQEKGKVEQMPKVSLVRFRKVEELIPKDKIIKDIVDFYHNLRQILNSNYKKKEEFRKNVALVTPKEEVDIDKLKEYADITKKYIYYLEEQIK